MMSGPRNSLARAGGAAVCTCTLAAGLVVVSDVAGPPSAAPPTVALAAAPQPLTASGPELIARLEQFTALIDPLIPEDLAPQRYSPASATAAPGLATSVVGTTIANGIFRAAGLAVRAVITVLLPFVKAPVIGQPVAAAVIITLFGGGLAAAAAASVILRIDEAVSSLVGFIGSALGRLFRLPAALLSGATAVPSPRAPRTDGAFATDVHAARTADTADIPNPAQSPRHHDGGRQSPPETVPDGAQETAPTAEPTPLAPAGPDVEETRVAEPPVGDTPSTTKTPPEPAEPPVTPRTKVRHSHGNAEQPSRDSAGSPAAPGTGRKKTRTAPSHPEVPSSVGASSTADPAAS